MRLLLDTHTFMGWDITSSRLPPSVRSVCNDRSNTLLLSVASVWEIQIKTQLGKLHLGRPLLAILADQQQANQLQIVPVTLAHVAALHGLPMVHRDPFDRLLVAVALVESATLASGDPIFHHYPVPLLWQP